MANIMDGKRPERPAHPKLTDSLWELAEQCWTGLPEVRPEVKKVIDALNGMSVPPWYV